MAQGIVSLGRVVRRVGDAPTPEGIAHGQAVAGAGPTTAGDATIGTITLPAGGPWHVFAVWSLIAAATATAAESRGGHFRLDALDGDISPNPAPSRFPTGIIPSFLGATQPAVICPLAIFPTDFVAPGKARLSMIYNEPTDVTVATQVVLGFMFGRAIPEVLRFTWIDRVRAQVTAAADTSIGTITLAESAKMITHVGCVAAQDNVLTAAEELIGFFRLSSEDVNLAPAQYPISQAWSAGLGATIGQVSIGEAVMLPVNIPVVGGARIDCFIDLNTALTNAAEVEVFVAYA